MSKVTDLGLNLIPTRLPKKNIVATDKAEEITSKIHAIAEEPEKATKKEAKGKGQGAKKGIVADIPASIKSAKKRTARTIIEDPDAVRKTSFDFPVSLYRSMKIRLAEDGVSMRDYVIGLIEDDLNSR